MAEPVHDVDWRADPWFTRYHADNLTDEFKAWWVGYYGPPSAYSDDPDEQREYWVRCGFALTGWLSSAWREREACAALCEHLSLDGLDGHEYAEAIRKRGA